MKPKSEILIRFEIVELIHRSNFSKDSLIKILDIIKKEVAADKKLKR